MANPQAQNAQPQLEYVTIRILRGQVDKIEPKRADTESASEAANADGIAGALNKLGEYGFRLLEGSTLLPAQPHGPNEGVLFMYRER